jgi:hypothetical protein
VLDLSPKLEREEEGEGEVSTETEEKTDEKTDEDTKPGKLHIFCYSCHPAYRGPGVGIAHCGETAPYEGVVRAVEEMDNNQFCEPCRAVSKRKRGGSCRHWK